MLALDYLGNALLFLGWHDEWISTRAWRMKDRSRFWGLMHRGIDRVALAMGQKNHCYWSYISDKLHRAIPPEQR